MKPLRLLVALCLLGLANVYSQSNLPTCKEGRDTPVCNGILKFPNGARYEGEFRDGVRFGRGIEFDHRGNISRDGYWHDWEFSKTPISVPPTKFPSTVLMLDASILAAKTKCFEIGFKQGTEGYGKCVLQLSK